jgi:hypothetical protein
MVGAALARLLPTLQNCHPAALRADRSARNDALREWVAADSRSEGSRCLASAFAVGYGEQIARDDSPKRHLIIPGCADGGDHTCAVVPISGFRIQAEPRIVSF